MTRLKACCGCRWTLQSDNVITPTEVLRAADAHANEANHTIILQGVIEKPRPGKVFQPREISRTDRDGRTFHRKVGTI